MFRRSILVLIVVVGLTALGSLLVGQIGLHRQTLKACFDNVQGLRPGAEVRMAGVDIGTAGDVRPYPQNKGCPAEIEMRLATSYELHIPSDAQVEIETAGVLGASFVNIDVSQASGAPADNYSYLRSKPTPPPISTGDLVGAARAFIAVYDTSDAIDRVATRPQSGKCGTAVDPSRK